MPKPYSRIVERWRRLRHFFYRRKNVSGEKAVAFALWQGNRDAVRKVRDDIMRRVNEEHIHLAIEKVRAQIELDRLKPNLPKGVRETADEARDFYASRQESYFTKRARSFAAEKALDLIGFSNSDKSARDSIAELSNSHLAFSVHPSLSHVPVQKKQGALNVLYPILGSRAYEFLDDYQRICYNILHFKE